MKHPTGPELKKRRKETISETAVRGELIKRRRAARLSQAALARMAGTSICPIVRFEQGKKLRPIFEEAVRRAYDRIIPGSSPLDIVSRFDAAWLRRQTESFLRNNCAGVVEKDKKAHVVLATERIYEYGRVLLLAVGKNID